MHVFALFFTGGSVNERTETQLHGRAVKIGGRHYVGTVQRQSI